MADPLTIALILEAEDNATELIDVVRENLETLAAQANDTSATVAAAADQMTTSLDATSDSSNAVVDSMERQTAASEETSGALDDQAGVVERLVAAMQEEITATQEFLAATQEEVAAIEEVSLAIQHESDELDELAAASEDAATGLGLIDKAATAAALAGLAVVAISAKLAISFQDATAALAGEAGISEGAANKIGNAFLAAGGKTVYTATQMMQAFSPVSGMFVNLYGHALDAADSMKFMDSAMTLAEATGGSLTSTTAMLANVMTAFHLKLTQVNGAANDLFNTSRLLGVGADTLGSSIARLEPKIAGSGISLEQLTGFMTEFAKSAGNGRTAVRLAGTMIQALVSPSADATQELATLGINVDNSKGKFIGLTAVISKLHDALTKMPATANLVSEAQTQYKLKMEEATLATEPQTKAVQTQETALSSQVSALGNASDALSKTAVMQELFGKNAALAAKIIADGVPAIKHSEDAVTKQGEAAKAAAEKEKTFAGQVDKLKSAAETLFIELGRKLLPVMIELAHKTIDALDGVVKWTDRNKEATKIILELTGAVIGLMAAMKVASILMAIWTGATEIVLGVVEVLSDGFILLAGYVGAFIIAIMVAVKQTMEYAAKWKESWAEIKELWNDAVDFFQKISNAIMDAFAVVFNAVVDASETAYHAVLDVWDAAGPWFESEVIAPIVRFFEALWDATTSGAVTAWHGIVSAWDATASWFNSNVIQPTVGFFETLWGYVSGAASTAWHAVVGAWDAAASWFNSTVIQPVVNFFKALWDDISGAAKTTWSAVVGAWNAAASWFNSTVIQPVIGFFETLWNGLKMGAIASWDGLVEAWDAASSWFDNTVIKPIENFFEDLWDKIVDGARTAVNDIEGVFKGVGNIANDLTGGVLGDVTGFIKHLAAGALVSSPTLALVGEAGPELVLPLSTLGGAGAIGGGGVSALPAIGGSESGGTNLQVNVTLNGQVYGSLEQMANTLGRQLATIIVPGAGTRLTVK